jgi:putative nucleotidyltransferase with HDIG domain
VSPEKMLKDEGSTSEQKIQALMDMTEQNLAEIFFAHQIPEPVAEKSGRIIRNFVVMMGEDPKLLGNLIKMASYTGDYLYYHSVCVSIFSMLIAKAAGQMNSRLLEMVALGGFLHDIGMTQVPPVISNSKRDLTPDEWKEMKQHPKHGLRMLEASTLVADDVRYIVYQHHEEPNGGGYPNGLRGAMIFILQK